MTKFKVFLAEKVILPDDDLDELHEKLSNTHQGRIPSQEHLKSLGQYKLGNLYDHVKHVKLRIKNLNDVEELKHLKDVTNNPIGHEVTLYRGIWPDAEPHKWKPGMLVKDHGPVSTTIEYDQGKKFSRRIYAKKTYWGQRLPSHHYVAIIRAKPTDKGFYVDHEGSALANKHEKELILHPGTTFKVLGRQTSVGKHYFIDDRIHHIDMEIHHQDD